MYSPSSFTYGSPVNEAANEAAAIQRRQEDKIKFQQLMDKSGPIYNSEDGNQVSDNLIYLSIMPFTGAKTSRLVKKALVQFLYEMIVAKYKNFSVIRELQDWWSNHGEIIFSDNADYYGMNCWTDSDGADIFEELATLFKL